jgi:Type IV secretion-system coupling protein DNA-binding domain
VVDQKSPQQKSQGNWDAFTWAILVFGLCSIFAIGYLTFSRIQQISCVPSCSSTSSLQTNLDTEWPLQTKIGLALLALGIAISPIFGVSTYLLYRQTSGKAQAKKSENYIRGAVLGPEDSVNALTAQIRAKEPGPHVSFGRVLLPQRQENLNTAVCGAPGSGKSTFIDSLLITIAQRRLTDKVLIYDRTGTFAKKHYNPERGDIILGPSEHSTHSWNPWHENRDEIQGLQEEGVQDFTNFVLPDPPPGKDTFWLDNQRVLLRELIKKVSCRQELRELLTLYPQRLITLLQGTPAFPALSSDYGDKFISGLATSTDWLDLLDEPMLLNQQIDSTQTNEFSFREWATNDAHQAWVFIICPARHARRAKPLIALYFDLLFKCILEREEDHTGFRRLWAIMDELSSAAYQPRLSEFLTEGRKYGACGVLGFQFISQIRKIYGTDDTDTIFAACQNKFFLRSTDAKTNTFLAENIGTQDYFQPTFSVTKKDGTKTRTESFQRANDFVFLPSEFRDLPPLNGILSIPGYPACQVALSRAGHSMPTMDLPTQSKKTNQKISNGEYPNVVPLFKKPEPEADSDLEIDEEVKYEIEDVEP